MHPIRTRAQEQSEPNPRSFDVASVKLAKPGTRGYSVRPLPGRLSASNATLKIPIAEAYHAYEFQISGGAKWLDTERYDIEALTIAKGGPKFQKSQDPEGQPLYRLFQRRQITAQLAPPAWLTETLSPLLGRPEPDKTGLEGVYDYKLEWTPDEFQAASDEKEMPPYSAVPSLSGALVEQLGLRLQAQRGPVEIVVVDRAEKATAN